ncbi:MAG TPA: four helix bundle protein [Pyrinomonadaceae bacterium]
MKYKTFEELPVWQAAVDFALLIFKFTNIADLRGFGDTRNQLERSALSISNNVAEGFERETTAELINFLYIARGSAGESRSMLAICERVPRFSNFKSEISNLKNNSENISKQLHGWIEALKNTKIKGNKYLNERKRKKYEWEKGLAEFDAEMAEFRGQHLEILNKRELEAAMLRTVEEGS